MQTKPIYVFDDLTQLGIDKVPINSPVIFQNIEEEKTLQVLKKSNTGVNNTTTVATFLANDSLYSYMSGDVTAINDIIDVVVTSPDHGDVLSYDDISETWINTPINGGSF